MLLVDADPAPRRALAGQLATHLQTDALTEAPSVEHAMPAAPEAGFPATWHLAVVSAADTASGERSVSALRTVQPSLPVLLMLSAGSAAGRSWPAGVRAIERPARLATLVALARRLLADTDTDADADAKNDANAERREAATNRDAASAFRLGPYVCDPGQRTVTDPTSGRAIPLTEKEAAILSRLHAETGPVGREALLAGVWGYADGVTTHTLETHIHRLRRKIESDPRQPRLLLRHGGGYRLGR